MDNEIEEIVERPTKINVPTDLKEKYEKEKPSSAFETKVDHAAAGG